MLYTLLIMWMTSLRFTAQPSSHSTCVHFEPNRTVDLKRKNMWPTYFLLPFKPTKCCHAFPYERHSMGCSLATRWSTLQLRDQSRHVAVQTQLNWSIQGQAAPYLLTPDCRLIPTLPYFVYNYYIWLQVYPHNTTWHWIQWACCWQLEPLISDRMH